MATNDNTTGNFTVLVDKDGILTGPFTTDGTLDFISKNNLATDEEVTNAKSEAIEEAEKKVSAAKEELTEAIASSKELITVTSTIDIGGIKKDTKFEDRTNAYLWEQLLNKELFPSLNPPSSTFTSVPSSGTLKEVGENISIEFNSTFNRGSIIGQGYEITGDDSYRAGLPTKRVYEGDDLAGEDTSSDLTVKKSISSYVVAKGSQTWSCTVSYGKGPQPKTNKGNDYDSPLLAGTLEEKSVSITGTYPFFATTSSIESPTKQSLVKLDTTSIRTAMVDCKDKNFWILEVPACWTITNVTGAASGQLGGNATNAVKQWTRKNKVKTINDNNIKYYRYEYGADNAPKKGADTLTFSIKYDSNKSLSTSLDEGATWEEE